MSQDATVTQTQVKKHFKLMKIGDFQMQYIYVFEDNQYSKLFPLVYTRTVFELRCGMFSALERIARHYPHAIVTLFCRDFLSDVLRERYSCRVNSLHTTDDTCLFFKRSRNSLIPYFSRRS
ncbi:MAG: hypothetical protein AYP45_00085 [Candidatus Brocadia carolinensis]|uniref:Uncharacterized protein n=1 Tax=Candidatus Brocadia carolinensis TaxID=1004156 RepID=A0A1V4AY33_9BACT|nr:MAG: hypothetical protein AYP45_00085 [Candidatus Brocadia caroliniensis]